MNGNLLSVVKQITAQYGEEVLNDARRLKAFFNDLAKDEPKPLRIAFGRCIEEGAYYALKTAPDAAERASHKASIAQRVRNEHGLDPALSAEALDILEAALYSTASAAPSAAPKKARPPQSAPVTRQPAFSSSAGSWYDRAIADYTEALRIDSNHAEACFWRGVAYKNKGDYDRAIADYTAALRIDPNNANAKEALEIVQQAKSGCFITAAVCGYLAKPDGCPELTAFRQFRDGWLAGQRDGPALIKEYYRIAPCIVEKINASPFRDRIYASIWDTHLSVCLRFIKYGRFAECKALYQNMVNTLAKEYLS